MFSIIIGIIFILFTVFACLPKSLFGFGLEWGEYVIQFLKGGVPVLSAVIGLVIILLGIASVRENIEAKREEEEARLEEERLNKSRKNSEKSE